MKITRPWLRCAVLGMVVVGSLFAGGTASAADNIDHCVIKLTSNPASTSCNVSQAATGDQDNIVVIDILIDQKAATGAQDADVDLDIEQVNTGTGNNVISGTIKVVQNLSATSVSNITQTQNASITGLLSSETTSGDVVVDLNPIIDMQANANAKGAAGVVQTQDPLIDLDVDLLSDTGDIDADFKPVSGQKLSATSRTGTIEQTQSPNGGIFLDIETHTEGLTDVSATNDEKQQAEANSGGSVDQEQFGPNLLGMRLGSDPADDADATLKTSQQCNRDDCQQSNSQSCDVETEGDGNCTLDTNQSSDNATSSQTCSVIASSGGCTIKAPDNQTFNCEASCFQDVDCGEGGCSDDSECVECVCTECFITATPERGVTPRTPLGRGVLVAT